jgi:hypothetical protein
MLRRPVVIVFAGGYAPQSQNVVEINDTAPHVDGEQSSAPSGENSTTGGAA